MSSIKERRLRLPVGCRPGLRVWELAERYETPLPKLGSRVAELEAKVNLHLEKMGFAWK